MAATDIQNAYLGLMDPSATGNPPVRSFGLGASQNEGVRLVHLNPVGYDGYIDKHLTHLAGWGYHASVKRMFKAHMQQENPPKQIILEQGHLGRKTYFQVGPHINWMPSAQEDYSPERIEAHGIFASPQMKRMPKGGGYLLILAQKSGDAQHNIVDSVDWCEELAVRLRQVTDDKFPIRVRLHPMDTWKHKPRYVEQVSNGKHTSLEDDLAGARAIVTYNSNAGLKALLAGKRVFCDPGAPYSSACMNLWDDEQLAAAADGKPTAWEPLEDAFSMLKRLAWSQFTVKEFEQPFVWQFLAREGVV